MDREDFVFVNNFLLQKYLTTQRKVSKTDHDINGIRVLLYGRRMGNRGVGPELMGNRGVGPESFPRYLKRVQSCEPGVDEKAYYHGFSSAPISQLWTHFVARDIEDTSRFHDWPTTLTIGCENAYKKNDGNISHLMVGFFIWYGPIMLD